MTFVRALAATLALVPATGVAAPFVTAAEALAVPALPADLRSAYGSEPEQFGDLRVPAGAGPHPVVVLLHGGCWRAFATSRYLDRLAADLTARGVATWNLEYRRVDSRGGGWPATFLDVADGVDHLRSLTTAHRLDLARVVVVGHSAGGHLALWAAGRSRIREASPLHRAEALPLRGAVALAGIADLEGFRATGGDACGSGIVDNLVGGAPEAVPDRYAAASPVRLLPLGVPQRLITGAADDIVPPRFAAAYVSQARAAGDDATATTIDGAAHFEIVTPGSSAWPAVRRAILDLVQRERRDGEP